MGHDKLIPQKVAHSEVMSTTFAIEYASTGRAKCQDSTCKQVIDKGVVRIAKLTPSPFDAEKVRAGLCILS